MSLRPLAFIGVFIIIAAIVAAGLYAVEISRDTSLGINDPNDISSESIATSTATSTPVVEVVELRFSSSTVAVPLPTDATQIDTSSWQVRVDNSAGFSIEHPPNLVESSRSSALTLVFPKTAYFRWPLQDDAGVTVYSGASCPSLPSGYMSYEPVKLALNGREFIRTVSTDVGAGQRSFEVAYDTMDRGRCFRVSLHIRGANGSGFYVDNSSLIRRYDEEHVKDLEAVIAITNAMIRSFRILASTP